MDKDSDCEVEIEDNPKKKALHKAALCLRAFSLIVVVGVGYICFDIAGGAIGGILWFADYKPGLFWEWSHS